MGRSQKKKLALFNLFSRNLGWVKEHVSFTPDFSNGIICPLCFDPFFEKDLDPALANPLTLEDIPPVSLGGKAMALTCKKCNSKSGHELDAHLLKSLLEADAQMFLPNSRTDASFSYQGNKMNGGFQVDEKGTVRMDLDSDRSNPVQADEFMKQVINRVQPFRSPNFNIRFKQSADERRAEIALLRIAYLIAFATLGHGFLTNNNLTKIREQIGNPDQEILPKSFWIKYDFEKEMEGINIMGAPKELNCFLIIFSLHTKSKSRRFAIALPGPTDPGLKAYNFITEKLCTGDGSQLFHGVVEHMKAIDFLREKKNAFASHQFWNWCVAKEYTPVN